MVDLIEIKIEEFKKDIYCRYLKIFPKEERRGWKKIVNTYNKGIEKFYKIMLGQTIIGFFMLEKIDGFPYYLDYFAIFEEYQSNGYGSQAINKLLNILGKEEGVCCEIEQIDINIPITVKRWNFYQKLGFKKVDSQYKLYKVLFSPLIISDKKYEKEDIDKILFSYYNINCGSKEVKQNCKIIR